MARKNILTNKNCLCLKLYKQNKNNSYTLPIYKSNPTWYNKNIEKPNTKPRKEVIIMTSITQVNMKIYEIIFFETAHKYSTTVKAENIENAISFAEIICDIPVGNIVEIKEVKKP